MKKPLITNIQKYSIHDGEGTRTTVFFKGCPLSCRWCHNPETQNYRNVLLFYEERCTGCGYCAGVCPRGAVSIRDVNAGQAAEAVGTVSGRDGMAMQSAGAVSDRDGKAAADDEAAKATPSMKAVTDAAKCEACGECVEECVNNAREICARTWEIADLVKEVLKDRIFYETSGGGVTLSGGEVLAQDMDYIEELMKRLHSRGISVYVDTCGAVPWANLERVIPYADTFLYDVKFFDTEKHRCYTGQGNEGILANLLRLSGTGAKIWIRIPVIGGVNDDTEEIQKIGEFLKENDVHVSQVNLLPYHNTGSSKYGRVGMTYQGNDFYVPKPEAMEQLKEVMSRYVTCPVKIGG